MYPNPRHTIFHYNLMHRLESRHALVRYLLIRKYPLSLAHKECAQQIDDFFREFERFIMPPKKRASNYAYEITWKRIDFNPIEKQEFLAWVAKGDYDFGELLAIILNDGDRITMKFSDKDDFYYVTIMGTDESHRNKGIGFSSYAKDAKDALLVALYKYAVLLEGDMTEAGDQASKDDFG